MFGLANLADALEIYLLGDCEQQLEHIAAHSLPAQIAGDSTGFDALTLFSNNHWLSERISRCQRKLTDKATHLPDNLGEQLKQSVIAQYSQTSLISVAP